MRWRVVESVRVTIIANPRNSLRAQLVFAALALVVGAISYFARGADAPATASDAPVSAPSARASAAPSSALLDAIRTHASEVWVETDADVVKLLPDDRDGDRHQRFLVDVDGHSLLVAHNIDLAPRVPVAVNDSIRLRARYEWNEKGGVLHWTHRDPRKPSAGGWIRVDGEVYE
jgi:hypothetical protein